MLQWDEKKTFVCAVPTQIVVKKQCNSTKCENLVNVLKLAENIAEE